jgi:hypothetical protein
MQLHKTFFHDTIFKFAVYEELVKLNVKGMSNLLANLYLLTF